jgi:hypothetical protein
LEADADIARKDDEIGLLALSRTSFKYSGNIMQSSAPQAIGYLMGIRALFHLSNKGIHLTLPLVPIGDKKEFLAILSCGDVAASEKRTAIWMKDISTNGGRYMRVKSDKLEMVDVDLMILQYQQICAQFLNTKMSQSTRDNIGRPIVWSGWALVLFLLAFDVQSTLHGSRSFQTFAAGMNVIFGATCLFVYLQGRKRRGRNNVDIRHWLRETDL